jgi:outer membrane protein assembly factor BamD (BamD/ComL family)
VFETAQFEEHQNNPGHARELYQEVLTRYPQSPYAKKAEERLRVLDKKN